MSKLAIILFTGYFIVLTTLALPSIIFLYQILYINHTTVAESSMWFSVCASVIWLSFTPVLGIVSEL